MTETETEECMTDEDFRKQGEYMVRASKEIAHLLVVHKLNRINAIMVLEMLAFRYKLNASTRM